MSGIASLQEINTAWTLLDVMDANDATDLQAEADAKAMEKP